DAHQLDALETGLASALERESQLETVVGKEAHFERCNMSGVLGQAGGVDEREFDDTPGLVDFRGLETRLILGPAEVSHPQVGAVEMVDAGHRRYGSLWRAQLFHDRPAT